MMLHHLMGAGVPNIYLKGGVAMTGNGNDRAISYSNLDGLYSAIGRAVALRTGSMTGGELRFLRKRLGMSQTEITALSEKTDQVVAKWEKGMLPVPKAEANLVRLMYLGKLGLRRDIFDSVGRLATDGSSKECPIFVFVFSDSHWTQDDDLAMEVATMTARRVADDAIVRAIDRSKIEVKYTLDAGPFKPVSPIEDQQIVRT